MITISIAKDFSSIPGARHITDGPFSGEEFRQKCLEPYFSDPSANEEIRVVLDGLEGYPISFLEEAFGGISRKYGTDRVLKKLSFISNENPLLIEQIIGYIKDPTGSRM